MHTTPPRGATGAVAATVRRSALLALLATLLAALLGGVPAHAAPTVGATTLGAHTDTSSTRSTSGTGKRSTKKKTTKKKTVKKPPPMKRVEKPRSPRSRQIKPYKKDRGVQVLGTKAPVSAPCSVVGPDPAAWPAGLASCY